MYLMRDRFGIIFEMGVKGDDWEYFVTHDLMGCHSALVARGDPVETLQTRLRRDAESRLNGSGFLPARPVRRAFAGMTLLS